MGIEIPLEQLETKECEMIWQGVGSVVTTLSILSKHREEPNLCSPAKQNIMRSVK